MFLNGLVALACALTTGPLSPDLIPQPAKLEFKTGAFKLDAKTFIAIAPGQPKVKQIAGWLSDALTEQTGLEMPVREVVTRQADRNCIRLASTGKDEASEAYTLEVTPQAVRLQAGGVKGVFRGIQSIRQLLPFNKKPTHKIPCLQIEDHPRFPWRGMLLDCGRHFMSKSFVKRYIDLLAYHKMNVLHWHLTEDQGWRVEIKKYPKLMEIAAWRGKGADRYGGFYSQDDIREIVAYAAERHVTVVPEIEMPGHSVAALAAYPELSCTGEPIDVSTRWGVHSDVYCAGNEKTFQFLEDVLQEVFELFPSEFIHIGGDECPKTRWEKCSKCQARIKSEGLKDEHELQSYFIRRMEKYLNANGRRLIGWDEILEGGLAPNATVQSWRGMNGAIEAAQTGHDVISSPTSHCYLDYPQSPDPNAPGFMGMISLRRIYAFEPTPEQLTPEQQKHVLGAEGNMWTEHAPQPRVDHQVFPRLCALSEVTWSPKATRNWKNFYRRMQKHYRRLDGLGVTYYVAPPRCTSPNMVFTDSIEVALKNPTDSGVVRFTLDGSEPTGESQVYKRPFRLSKSAVLKARTFLKPGHASDIGEIHFQKQTPRAPVKPGKLVRGLDYRYFEGNWRKLPSFDEIEHKSSGSATTIDLASFEKTSGIALVYDGFFEARQGGVYTFHLESDDGSRLWMGQDLVIDHDGLHSPSRKTGQVILKAGFHPIRIGYFQAGGARTLGLTFEVAGSPETDAALQMWRPGARSTEVPS